MKVASFSGGGEKALIFLPVINYIEHSTGKHAQDLFDGFAGTSTGAITALALAKRDPLWASEIIKLYLGDANQIFPGGFWRSLQGVFGLKGDKYTVGGLEKLLKQTFGPTEPMTNLAKPVCITTMDATVLSSLVITEQNPNWYVWEAARASSAGPTYFAPYIHDNNNHAYVDGGVNANAPDMVACDRWKLWANDGKANFMLSLGTGFQTEGWTPAELNDIGELRWVTKVLTLAMDGVARAAVAQARDCFPASQYLRLDPALPGDLGNMDQTDPKKLARLYQLGVDSVAANQPALDAFIAKLLEKT